jgi:hypothetical protein
MGGESAKGTGILAGILMMAGIAVAIPVICARRVLAAAAARRRAGDRRRYGRRQWWRGQEKEVDVFEIKMTNTCAVVYCSVGASPKLPRLRLRKTICGGKNN